MLMYIIAGVMAILCGSAGVLYRYLAQFEK